MTAPEVDRDDLLSRLASQYVASRTHDGMTPTPATAPAPTAPVDGEVDSLADWLGEMDESRNVFDYTDEATTVINIDVETLAQRLAPLIAAREAHALREAGDDIQARLHNFRRLDADREYLNALNDAWGLVANRRRHAEARADRIAPTTERDGQ